MFYKDWRRKDFIGCCSEYTMKKIDIVSWKNELARDLIALGSIPFFLLVLVRIHLLNNPVYLNQFIFSGIVFLGLFFIFRLNLYSGLGLIVLFFTSMYYNDIAFTIFGSIIYLFIIASLFYLKYDMKKVFLGILAGVIGIAIGYVLA